MHPRRHARRPPSLPRLVPQAAQGALRRHRWRQVHPRNNALPRHAPDNARGRPGPRLPAHVRRRRHLRLRRRRRVHGTHPLTLQPSPAAVHLDRELCKVAGAPLADDGVVADRVRRRREEDECEAAVRRHRNRLEDRRQGPALLQGEFVDSEGRGGVAGVVRPDGPRVVVRRFERRRGHASGSGSRFWTNVRAPRRRSRHGRGGRRAARGSRDCRRGRPQVAAADRGSTVPSTQLRVLAFPAPTFARRMSPRPRRRRSNGGWRPACPSSRRPSP
mmetsp:Transcript_14705/g.47966  ORF Transcript_14705/g.47966 Transcript_14705/m.47966 type:complete len:274 (+) Transcript_14705:2297-3118(+)